MKQKPCEDFIKYIGGKKYLHLYSDEDYKKIMRYISKRKPTMSTDQITKQVNGPLREMLEKKEITGKEFVILQKKIFDLVFSYIEHYYRKTRGAVFIKLNRDFEKGPIIKYAYLLGQRFDLSNEKDLKKFEMLVDKVEEAIKYGKKLRSIDDVDFNKPLPAILTKYHPHWFAQKVYLGLVEVPEDYIRCDYEHEYKSFEDWCNETMLPLGIEPVIPKRFDDRHKRQKKISDDEFVEINSNTNDNKKHPDAINIAFLGTYKQIQETRVKEGKKKSKLTIKTKTLDGYPRIDYKKDEIDIRTERGFKEAVKALSIEDCALLLNATIIDYKSKTLMFAVDEQTIKEKTH